MDLRTIIASCLIPVLFGFLAEALPPHYYSQSPAALPTNDDYTENSDQDYDNNYGNDDDLEKPPLDYDTDTRISDIEHDNNGINFYNFPVNDFGNESGERESETRFSDWEHGVDYYNLREPQYIDSQPKIIKVFKVMKIIHRNDMQGKGCRRRGYAFDSMRGRCVRN
ncbi:uncharacterized protein LOC111063072 isoform X5 [Nilaparvata lugens]|uniref:uncharacterized protein LOC111063072 isoform X5 n=1 Tax=Nilaparvata lugens TaxID=108931 RepID=UPI00193E51C2|nr:uncharacterized protein LOC111063072 isoform X5 [Nilaparvata lugens]